MGNFGRLFKGVDKWLFIFIIALSIIGMVVVYSSTKTIPGGGGKLMLVQSGALIIGIIAMIVIMSIDYESFGNGTKVIYAINIFLLVIVLIPKIGTGGAEVGGQSWMRFGSIGIQPAELVKVGFVLTFAKHLERIRDDVNRFLPFLGLCLHAGILIGLVLLQPDYGTAMVYVFIFVCMVFTAGIYYKYILYALGGFIAFSPIAWFFILKPYQKERFLTFFNSDHALEASGYQVLQSKIAIGSGTITGKGLFQGTQTQLNILPAKHTDFIFGVVGEEMGFLGAMLIIILLFAIFIKCIMIAKSSRSAYGSYICVGIGSMLLFHIFENIGMCMGLTPVTGIPLPFLSYGGSYMLTVMIAMGLVMNVWMRRKTINF